MGGYAARAEGRGPSARTPCGRVGSPVPAPIRSPLPAPRSLTYLLPVPIIPADGDSEPLASRSSSEVARAALQAQLEALHLPTGALESPRSAIPVVDADLLRIPVGPGAVHVERYGYGGQPVVLLHGFGTSSFLWRRIGPALAVERCTAFAIDLFGHGESDRPIDADFGVSQQSEYVERALTALRVARAVVVGVDLGALVAMRLAADRGERVEKLVLISPPSLTDVPGRDVRELQTDAARLALRLSQGLFGIVSLLRPLLEDSVADPAHMPPKLLGRYLAPYLGSDGVDHLLALARAIQAADVDEIELADIYHPTLLVRGDRDQWSDGADVDRLARRLTSAKTVHVEGIGRLVPEEAPDLLTDLILRFAAER